MSHEWISSLSQDNIWSDFKHVVIWKFPSRETVQSPKSRRLRLQKNNVNDPACVASMLYAGPLT